MKTGRYLAGSGALIALGVVPLLAFAQPVDTSPPTVPTNLNPVSVSSSAIDLSWGASTDNIGVQGYKVYRSDVQIATTTSAAYQDTGLAAATNYIYNVAAFDAAGNTSAKSLPSSTATQSGTGTGGGTGGVVPAPAPTPAPGAAAAPYDFKRQGIFDCNQNGAYAMSVGALSATGGVYVPVADNTVELNTGTLVYKECVLREVINREREAAMAAYGKRAVVAIQTGRNGNPQYVVDQNQELLAYGSDPTMLDFLQDGTLQNLNPAFQSQVTRATALGYETRTRAKESVLRCPYKGDLKTALTDPTRSFSWEEFRALSDPACNPLGAYYLARDLADARIARCQEYLQQQWDWGRGYYAASTDPNNPCRGKIVTPAVTMQASFQNIIDSPVRQLESANDIGQMINALYAGMTTQIISDNQGLAGLMQSTGGRASYLDQVASESASGLRNAALNVAIQVLTAARQVEAAYFQAANAIGATLTQTMAQLRSAENQCWKLIIPKVCTSELSAQNECTDGDGNTYKVSTSTAGFAEAVITAQITPLAAPASNNIRVSQNALRLIDQLIVGVTNTASLDAQRLALQQLDSLVAQKLLHVKPDVDGTNGIVKQLDNVQTTMTTLVTNTVKAWADDPSPSTGWCNVNNPAVVQGWKDRWKK
ncbi:MAG: fibronectin type III domain-containing protein [Patescibacteria group bacterium]